MIMTTRKFPVIDLFAGCGGLGLGVAEVGGQVVLSVDTDSVACDTLRANAEQVDRILEADVSSLTGPMLRKYAGLGPKDPVVIVGGPPCQPFSKAAYWTDSGEESRYRRARARGERVEKPERKILPRKDERRSLVREFMRLVQGAKADGFLFENVTSILHPRSRTVFDQFLASAISAGYKTTVVRANAVEYGIPQARKRIFVLGSKRQQPEVPIKTHTLSVEKVSSRLLPPVSAGEAITPFRFKKYFESEEVVSGRWAEHLREIPAGWNYKALSAWAGHPRPTFVAETRFWNFLLKLHPIRPSWTINANPGPWTGPFHWDSRRLRTVEMAALQTFPRGYVFAGTRREKVRQIGNAVPVRLAASMFIEVLRSLAMPVGV